MTVPARDARGPASPETPSGPDLLFKDIVGASVKMRRIFRLVAKVAPTDSTVLLQGESGTGKELIARSIHLQSRRSGGPFVAVNVGAIPETLVEAELFGHTRGAFTGAGQDRAGLIEEADHGTLFLDEIGDMPLGTQVKLLRTLESNEIRRVGDNATRIVDLRVVAATHRDLHEEVRAGRFRGDLYYRLRVVQIDVPPLRERREDIGLLASYFLERVERAQGKHGMSFSPEAIGVLERYDYPGNVRELENAIEHAVTLAEGHTITPADLPAMLRSGHLLPERAERAEAARPSVDGADRDGWSLAEVEKDHIRRVLTRHRGNATAAARQLGISRTTLWRKLREYGIARNEGVGT
jgi:DNA-binding NtrC family response regulator